MGRRLFKYDFPYACIDRGIDRVETVNKIVNKGCKYFYDTPPVFSQFMTLPVTSSQYTNPIPFHAPLQIQLRTICQANVSSSRETKRDCELVVDVRRPNYSYDSLVLFTTSGCWPSVLAGLPCNCHCQHDVCAIFTRTHEPSAN